MESNLTLLTPEDSALPAGTYIATGVSGVTQLAEYLDTYPEGTITRLISDSTVEEVDTRHGYLYSSAPSDYEDDLFPAVERATLTAEEERSERKSGIIIRRHSSGSDGLCTILRHL
ncbi:hypothetical protein C8R44DRAFT_751109 [Mycena epipterygia]|nr:hypothetical protein C8R44DRAFT_751109 [Mycena epipterygia]